MAETAETFQLSTEAAETYERTFVPTLFGAWATYLVDIVQPSPGWSVLDVACGTGAVARSVADRLGPAGHVVGVDLNEGMLAVARRIRPDLEWHQGDVADLPFPDGSFDAVVCQASLMYFPDRVQALAEMGRVAVARGTVAVQVWGSLEAQPAYLRFADVVARLADTDGKGLVESYFSLGDLDVLTGLFARAGLDVTGTHTHTGTMRFPSIEDFVRSEIDSTPLAARLSEQDYAKILADCATELAEFAADDGPTALPVQGHVVTATPR